MHRDVGLSAPAHDLLGLAQVGVVQETLREKEQRLATTHAREGKDGSIHGEKDVARTVRAALVHFEGPGTDHTDARGQRRGNGRVGVADPALVVALGDTRREIGAGKGEGARGGRAPEGGRAFGERRTIAADQGLSAHALIVDDAKGLPGADRVHSVVAQVASA